MTVNIRSNSRLPLFCWWWVGGRSQAEEDWLPLQGPFLLLRCLCCCWEKGRGGPRRVKGQRWPHHTTALHSMTWAPQTAESAHAWRNRQSCLCRYSGLPDPTRNKQSHTTYNQWTPLLTARLSESRRAFFETWLSSSAISANELSTLLVFIFLDKS